MLSDKDKKLLRELQRDCTQTMSQLSKKTNIPVSTLYVRIAKFEKEGIIKARKAILDPEKVGLPALGFVLVNVSTTLPNGKPVKQEKILAELMKIREIQEIHLITGNYDMLLKIRAKDMKELAHPIIEKVRLLPGVINTLTCFSAREGKETSDLDF